MGPSCRSKHGFNHADTEAKWDLAAQLATKDFPEVATLSEAIAKQDARRACNVLVHLLALHQSGLMAGLRLAESIAIVNALGYTKLADVLAKVLIPVRLKLDGDRYLVKSPYSDAFRALVSNFWGRWNKDEKCYMVPVTRKAELFQALKTAYAGMQAIGPRGAFTL